MAKGVGEIGPEGIVNLFVTGGAEVDAAERVLATRDGGNDLSDPVESQGAGGGLDVGKSLDDADLVARCGTADAIEYSVVC